MMLAAARRFTRPAVEARSRRGLRIASIAVLPGLVASILVATSSPAAAEAPPETTVLPESGTPAEDEPLPKTGTPPEDKALPETTAPPVWSATLTVAGLGASLLGCQNSGPAGRCDSVFTLTDDGIARGDVDTRVLGIVWDSQANSVSLYLDKDWLLPRTVALHVDGLRLSLDEAEYLSERLTADRLRWSLDSLGAAGVDWIPGDTVQLRLDGPAPATSSNPASDPSAPPPSYDPPPPSYQPPPPSYQPPPPSYDPPPPSYDPPPPSYDPPPPSYDPPPPSYDPPPPSYDPPPPSYDPPPPSYQPLPG